MARYKTGFSGAFFSIRGEQRCFWEWPGGMDSPKCPTPYQDGTQVTSA